MSKSNYRNPLDVIPEHLTPFIATQNSALYSPVDQAAWRFILKISQAFFKSKAHQTYLKGLIDTGISLETIPLISEMDECLKKFGWRAVGVSGFIPPAVFMEFQSLGILPIACEMRTLAHLAYTPAPDIVHEAAGHAPILSDPEYSEYLRTYGEVARKAIFSSQDMSLYEAIRDLSDIKENPLSSNEDIQNAEKELERAISAQTYTSEATYLARMNWWTVEYGLIGPMSNPKIYGAGLLSSVGESFNCLNSEVRKIPFSIDCVNTSYDITRPQPQLYVAPDFQSLALALHEFSNSMAFKKGGQEGLAKAQMAGTVVTVQLDTDVQVSGKLDYYLNGNSAGDIHFIKLAGPCQISYKDMQLEGHDAKYHAHGFSSPIGTVKGFKKPVSELEHNDFIYLGFKDNHTEGKIEFESGIVLTGVLLSKIERNGKNILLSFKNCSIYRTDEMTNTKQILFDPTWGQFDLICGKIVSSVFGGPADRAAYMRDTSPHAPRPQMEKPAPSVTEQKIFSLYSKMRQLRESHSNVTAPQLLQILNEMKTLDSNPLESNHWLIKMEALEIAFNQQIQPLYDTLKLELIELSTEAKKTTNHRQVYDMIQRGLEILK